MILHRRLLAVVLAAAAVIAVNSFAFGQENGVRTLRAYTTVRKSHPLSMSEILSAPRSKTIPFFTYSTVSSRDGKSYVGTIVGRGPFAPEKKKTRIPTGIVPIIITTENIVTAVNFTTSAFTTVPEKTTFDPTMADHSCLNPPNDIPLDTFVGNKQYVDAFQRANFWQLVGDTQYHTLLSPIKTPLAVHVDAPTGIAADLAAIGLSGCGTLGGIDYHSFDELV